VENVLRPSISCTGYNTEHVLHAERDAGPVVSLDLRHGDKEISLKHGARKPQVLHACVTGAQRCANQFIPIEIDETDLFLLEILIITTLRQH
jgi:hypothetical protein